MQNVDNFCTKEFTKSHIKSKMWIMWITLKKVIHKKNVVKSRVLKSYPHWKMSYPQVINNLSTVKNWEKLSTLGVIHILWITLKYELKNWINVDNVDNFQKSYPHQKPSKIKGSKRLSTMKSELSTSYPQVIHIKKWVKSYPHCMWITFQHHVEKCEKNGVYPIKMWTMWITFSMYKKCINLNVDNVDNLF